MPRRRTPREMVTVATPDAADDTRRVLLADWCRLVGQRITGEATPASAASATPAVVPTAILAEAAGSATSTVGPVAPVAPAAPARTGPAQAVATLNLPPRVGQTLHGLLAGRSEKQIALELSISQHTVHAYVKQLHKRLNVSSRGELLARFVAGNVAAGVDAG